MYQPPKKNEGLLTFFMLVSSIGIIYGIYLTNPQFMNKKPLSDSLAEGKKAMVPVPKPSMKADQKLEQGLLSQINNQRNFQFPNEFVIPSGLIRDYYKKFFADSEGTEKPLWLLDDEYLYLSSKNKFTKLNNDLEKVWWFEAQIDDQFVGRVSLSDDELFLATQKGYIYNLKKESGKLNWMLPTGSEIVYEPLIYRSFIFVMQKSNDKHFLLKLKGINGDVEWRKELIGFENPSPITINNATRLVLVTDPNGSLLSLDANNGNAYWQKKKLGPLQAPATAVGEMAFVATTDARAYGIQLKRRTVVWEYELKGGTQQAFTYLPLYNDVAIMTDDGYLHVINAKTGEGRWRYQTNNKQKIKSVVSLRLSAKDMAKKKMERNKNGWALMAPCLEDRLCFINPEKGQLMSRIRLRGELHSPPIFRNKEMLVTLKNPEKLPWSRSKEPSPRFALAKYSEYIPKKKPPQKDEAKKDDQSLEDKD